MNQIDAQASANIKRYTMIRTARRARGRLTAAEKSGRTRIGFSAITAE
jgi:hypothetical protein